MPAIGGRHDTRRRYAGDSRLPIMCSRAYAMQIMMGYEPRRERRLNRLLAYLLFILACAFVLGPVVGLYFYVKDQKGEYSIDQVGR